jgi:hypothetical protein
MSTPAKIRRTRLTMTTPPPVELGTVTAVELPAAAVEQWEGEGGKPAPEPFIGHGLYRQPAGPPRDAPEGPPPAPAVELSAALPPPAPTAPPWRWQRVGNDWALMSCHSGSLVVLDAVRQGTRGAAMRVRSGARCVMVPFGPEHPDAKLIAAAPVNAARVAAYRRFEERTRAVALELAAAAGDDADDVGAAAAHVAAQTIRGNAEQLRTELANIPGHCDHE